MSNKERTFIDPMGRKAIINMLLIIVLSIQLLPVVQVGFLLSGSQFTEELPHGCDGLSQMKWNSGDPKNILFWGQDFLSALSFPQSPEQFIERTVRIPDSFAGEIQTPPPNEMPHS